MEVNGQHRDPATLRRRRNVGTRWVGPRAGVDVLEREKISCSFRVLNPGPSSAERNHCTDYALQATNIDVKGEGKAVRYRPGVAQRVPGS
jgi:hypothetical protein